MTKRLAFVLFAAAFAACNNTETQKEQTIEKAVDKHTQSNADVVDVKHLSLDVKVDFDAKQIAGSATWSIENPKHADTLKLDTYDLTIDSVKVDGSLVQHSKGEFKKYLGTVLNIPIEDNSEKVTVYYKTGEGATALQWMEPQQTLSKKHPFLYTQSEAIYARSWIPSPDGPGIRFSYDARVQVPNDLIALMSATNPQQKNDSGIYRFEMEIPVPAYLMALGVGDVEFRAIDERTGVYADPALIDKAHNEFAEVGQMVHTAEELYGAYRWGRYDILVLPSGFPLGGMENPRLTFATPTIISGDRSLVNLIAHELAHSWSGNLVTNHTWNDFWLNEGFTVYFERRLTEKMTDKSYADMLWELGYQDLEYTVNEMQEEDNMKDSHLKIDLAGREPDEGLTDIAYEKGALFLKLIENTVGREKMDKFLNSYFDEHAFQTITTEEFIAYLQEHLIKGDEALAQKINIDAWVYGPGIPENATRADMERFEKVNAEREKFLSGTAPAELNTKGWTTHEWLHFLRKMPKPLDDTKMTALDKEYDFTHSNNSEIADLWYIMAVATKYKPAYASMEGFLVKVGRRKFLTPLYSEMMETGQTETAKSIYEKARSNYHPLAQGTLDALILNKQ
ncbi:MAG: M1 family metallopeptidase [Chitinophagales bacterium]|nr:M1 family metallopeptidase [Chitinophagales bacterium]